MTCSPMTIEYRQMTPADYESVVALWNSAPGVRASESRDEFARILERNSGLSSVALLGGRLVGAVFCCHDGRRGYLYHLAVAGDARRRGIARELVDRSLAGLVREGIPRCSIFLIADNEDGAAFWKQTGWRERTDLKLMAKDLK